MLVGVMLCLSLKTVPGLQVYALLAILLRFLRQKVPAVRWLLFAMLSGFFLAAFALLQADQHRLAASSIGTDIELQIRIQTIPVRQGRRTVFEAIRVDEHLGPSRLRLSYYGYGLDFKAGEQWRVTARLKPPDGLKNSGGFDRARWSIARGIHANGYLRESPRPERLAEAPGLSSTVLRQRLSASIAALPSATQTTAFVQALTLGLKHDISDQQWQLLRDSGTAHLLAISGLHISLMAGWALLIGTLVCRLLRHCFRNWPFSARSSGLCLALLIGSAYAMLAGFSLPTQRALIMLLVWSLAALRFRKLDASSGLGLALIAVLLFDPLAPLSPGFWLSFGTLAAILWLHTGKARPYSTQAPSMWARIVALFRVHVLLAIALLPVTALFFQSASLVSPLANLIAIPYVGLLIVPLSLLTLVFALPLPSLADFLLRLTHVLLEQMLNALDWMLIRLDGAIVASLPDLFTLFVCLLAFMLLCLPKILGWRWLAIPLILPALAFNARGSSVEELELHVLDVGQGLAALVLTRNHTVLYDTGGRMSPSLSMFESVVIPYLHALGRRRIDLLVVSHPDALTCLSMPAPELTT